MALPSPLAHWKLAADARDGAGTHHGQMDGKDVYSWNRIPSMAVFQGRFFAGTSTCHTIASARPHSEVDRVYSIEAGRNASFDEDLGAQWRHVAIAREARHLRLYIDGRLVFSSAPLEGQERDLTNANLC